MQNLVTALLAVVPKVFNRTVKLFLLNVGNFSVFLSMITIYYIVNSSFFYILYFHALKVFLFCFESDLIRIFSKFHVVQSKHNGAFILAFIDICFHINPIAKVNINWHKKIIHLSPLAGPTDQCQTSGLVF